MITLVLTYRDREVRILNNCLNSLQNQVDQNLKVILVDYGSSLNYSSSVKKICKEYKFVDYIFCCVENQLWNKSRAINIALRQVDTAFFMVGDIDMIFHPKTFFILNKLRFNNNFYFFQVGILTEFESKKNLDFNSYDVKFKTNECATGISLFKTEDLKSINGFDEFYNGWGAEDTDAHARLVNYGLKAIFYKEILLFLHQWHPKSYRSKDSTFPFHSTLEQINHSHLLLVKNNKIVKSNLLFDWGVLPDEEKYDKLNYPDYSITITNETNQFSAFVLGFVEKFKGKVLDLKVDIKSGSVKDFIKKILNKKHLTYLCKDEIENKLIEIILLKHRNSPYKLKMGKNQIGLKIQL